MNELIAEYIIISTIHASIAKIYELIASQIVEGWN